MYITVSFTPIQRKYNSEEKVYNVKTKQLCKQIYFYILSGGFEEIQIVLVVD